MVLKHLSLAIRGFAMGLARRAVAFAEFEIKSEEPTPTPEPKVPGFVAGAQSMPTAAQGLPIERGEETSDFMEWFREQEMLRQFHPHSPLIDADYDEMKPDALSPIEGIDLL